jgi:hypothetical protein
MSNGYPSDWDARRKRVYQRDNYTCQNCGFDTSSVDNASLHAHHIVPKSNGGSHRVSNLVALCKDCHNAIHHDIQAPTNEHQSTRKSNKELLQESLSKAEKLWVYIAENQITIQSPGEIKNKEVELTRRQGIKAHGRLSIYCSPSTRSIERVVNNWIKCGIDFLEVPEAAWVKKEERGLSDSEFGDIFDAEIKQKWGKYTESASDLQEIMEDGKGNELL